MKKQILLFSDYFSKFPDLDIETQKWIAQSIGGTLVADHPLTENEYSFVKSILEEEDVIWESLKIVLEMKEPLLLSSLGIPPGLAETIFKYVIKICLSNRKLASNEIHYINKVGTKLKIETNEKRKIFKQLISQTKDDFLHNLIENLNQKEKYWLAAMTLKIIYADGTVHPKELSHFNYVGTLLANHTETLKSVKEAAASKSVDEFEKVHFGETTIDLIMEYLFGIIMSDQDCSEEELSLIYEIAQTIEYDKHRLDKLIESVQLDSQYLFL